MKKVGIIGGGFSGTMTAVHLIQNASSNLEIIIINEKGAFNKGIAFDPYSKKFLLNVPTLKMSAFPDKQDDFLEWVMQQDAYKHKDRTIISNSFLPRHLYGEYLVDVWNKIINSENAKKIKLRIIESEVVDLDVTEEIISLRLGNDEVITFDACVIANGNNIPRNPDIKNIETLSIEKYFQNPWDSKSVNDVTSALPVIIIGNGLTMVDTVLGLLETGFNNEIYSISPNGFNILPHRHSGLKYTKFIDELSTDMTLFEIIKLFNKHINLIKEFGLSAEPIIDSLRPHTQKIWQRLSMTERKMFMSRLRHLWGVARHRIPLHIHDKIQHLQIDQKLHIITGKLLDFTENENGIEVQFYNKKQKRNEKIEVSRIINCTGPETDLMRLDNSFLKSCLLKGIVAQDELKLGINADTTTYQVIDSYGSAHTNLFTIGSNLKGVLWETTAVNELRQQAETIGRTISGL